MDADKLREAAEWAGAQYQVRSEGMETIVEPQPQAKDAARILSLLASGERVMVPRVAIMKQLQAAHDGPLSADEHRMSRANEEWLRDMYAAFIAAAPDPLEGL